MCHIFSPFLWKHKCLSAQLLIILSLSLLSSIEDINNDVDWWEKKRHRRELNRWTVTLLSLLCCSLRFIQFSSFELGDGLEVIHLLCVFPLYKNSKLQWVALCSVAHSGFIPHTSYTSGPYSSVMQYGISLLPNPAMKVSSGFSTIKSGKLCSARQAGAIRALIAFEASFP